METEEKYYAITREHLEHLQSGRFTIEQVKEIAQSYKGEKLAKYRDAIYHSITTYKTFLPLYEAKLL